MRWYINDSSLHGQYKDALQFIETLDELMDLRLRFEALRTRFYVTNRFSTALVQHGVSLRQLFQLPAYRERQGLVLRWLASAGPFLEDDRRPEEDDYFECQREDVTNSGLGECARRVKSGGLASSFSFPGGDPDYAMSPLNVFHGIPEDRLGSYDIYNIWSSGDLKIALLNTLPPPSSWRELIETSRLRFPKLLLPDAIHQCPALAREAFDSIICDRSLALFECLNNYMLARRPDGSETDEAQDIVREHFTGDRASFTGESATNREKFKSELTFPDPLLKDFSLFAPWHGKISHRYFRLHFEWPVPPAAKHLKVVYLGPKITKG